jgi:2-polyprenyl-3-methyl-5-hydroxy-6-metoxy-1,4-benzoquinol methylase
MTVKSDAKYTTNGISGEDVFQEKLIELLPSCNDILDAGCGRGAFKLEMVKHTKHICAFDFAPEMISIANRLKDEASIPYALDRLEYAYNGITTNEVLERIGL